MVELRVRRRRMSSAPSDTYTRWLVAYSQYAGLQSHDGDVTCPGCGGADFGLVFGAAPNQIRGRAEFWCNRCMVGTLRYGVAVVKGFPVLALDATTEDHTKLVPDFTTVLGLE
jgi:hypothetical protein